MYFPCEQNCSICRSFYLGQALISDVWNVSVISSFSFLFLLFFTGKKFVHFLLYLWRIWRSKSVGYKLRARSFFSSSFWSIRKFCKPLHGQNFLKTRSFVAVLFKKLFAHFNCWLGHLLPWVECEVRSVLDSLAGNFLVVFVVKGKNSAQKQVSDDTKRPQVHFFAVRFLEEHFRCYIRKSAKWI